jgi:hypothetical protein
MPDIVSANNGRSNPAASPVVVIRIEGARPQKPRRWWLTFWVAVMAMGLIVSLAASITNPNSSRELPSCVDPDAGRDARFLLRPPSEKGV